jgi:DNA polymerase III epsilon subunit-like protein
MNYIDIFRQSITVLDSETTNLKPEFCEIVEIAGATYHNKWVVKNTLLGSYNDIAFEASAKNNISRRMIAGLPKFDQNITLVKEILNWPNSTYFCAHNAMYDRKALKASFDTMGGIEDSLICDDQSRWLCTWRLSKQILINDFDDIQYGLSYLRYRLDLDVPDDTGVHRADVDTLVCAALLDKLTEIGLSNGMLSANDPLGPQLNELSWRFIPIKKWPIGGKHKGVLLEDLDNDYYVWALKTLSQLKEGDPAFDEDLTESIKLVLTKRLEDTL